jgi:hypothetical protein
VGAAGVDRVNACCAEEARPSSGHGEGQFYTWRMSLIEVAPEVIVWARRAVMRLSGLE